MIYTFEMTYRMSDNYCYRGSCGGWAGEERAGEWGVIHRVSIHLGPRRITGIWKGRKANTQNFEIY